MTHVTELALAAALIGALGLGVLAILPTPKPAPAAKLDIDGGPGQVRRAEPDAAKSDADKSDAGRIAALQRRVEDIKAEQRELAETVRALARERKAR